MAIYYIKSIGKRTTLLVSDVPQYIKLYNSIYHINEHNSLIGDVLKEDINFNSIPFKKVEPTIVTHKYCVLVIGESAVSTIHSNNNFHVFDPHKRNKYGLPASNGGSVLLKFSNFNSLSSYIHELSKSLNATQYELTPIKITKFKLSESNANTQKDTNYTTTRSRKPNAAKKENLPAGKNKSSTQLSNTYSKKSTYSYQNNTTTSNTPTTNTSQIETTPREQKIDNSTRRHQKKTEKQSNTKTKETPTALKRKLSTQKANNEHQKKKNM